MDPVVPLELQQIILRESLNGPASRSRQADRHSFMRVCRAWRDSLPSWECLEVIGLPQLGRLNGTLLNGRLVGEARLAVRSVYLELADNDKGQGNRAANKTIGLLALVPNLERLEIVMVPGALSGMDDTPGHNALRAVLPNCRKGLYFSLRGFDDKPWPIPADGL